MQKIVVAVTGASGSIYAKVLFDRLLQIKDQWTKVGVVMSDNARMVWEYELDNREFEKYPFDFFAKNDFMAPFASGSGQYQTMIVAPCSMGTLGRIAGGISDDLLTRAADVVLKERRKLILMVRDTPYNLIHLRNMETVTLAEVLFARPPHRFTAGPKILKPLLPPWLTGHSTLQGLKLATYRWGQAPSAED